MQSTYLQEIPDQYKVMINDINDRLRSIYSKFIFSQLEIRKNNTSNEIHSKESFLFDFLKKFRFITFQILSKNEDPEPELNLAFQTNDVIICIENQCLFIRNIKISKFKEIIQNIQKNSFVIDVTNLLSDDNKSYDYKRIQDEINNFYSYFREVIKNNNFVKMTIRPIATYLIRRYFCPTEYFNDSSFFTFEQSSIYEERSIVAKFTNLLTSNDEDNILNTNLNETVKKSKSNDIKYRKFNKNEFIILRTISSNDKSVFYLVLHIESLYIFMMKINDERYDGRYHEREIEFCKSYSHRCLTKFYGFVIEKGKVAGLIYEYMCHDSLDSYLSQNPEKNDELFSNIAINRIMQGIEYLHSRKLIHRDLKPSNILIDHDFLPYISGFDTIRHLIDESDEPMTYDFCSVYFMSPEQYVGTNISYASDIYSFGLLIYYIIEGKRFLSLFGSISDTYELLRQAKIEIPANFKASKNIRAIINQCIKYKPEERITIEEIKNIFINEISTINSLEQTLKNESDPATISKITHFIYESILIQFDPLKYISSSSFPPNLELLQEKGYKNLNSTEYNKLTAKEKNADCLLNFGILYETGFCFKQDLIKARQYYELAADQNNSYALNNLGNLYEKGHGVEQSYIKAEEYSS